MSTLRAGISFRIAHGNNKYELHDCQERTLSIDTHSATRINLIASSDSLAETVVNLDWIGKATPQQRHQLRMGGGAWHHIRPPAWLGNLLRT